MSLDLIRSKQGTSSKCIRSAHLVDENATDENIKLLISMDLSVPHLDITQYGNDGLSIKFASPQNAGATENAINRLFNTNDTTKAIIKTPAKIVPSIKLLDVGED